MIDWSKERSEKNYCGWCIGSPPSANCNGKCFTDGKPEYVLNNKINHLKIEIKKSKKRLCDLENELRTTIDEYEHLIELNVKEKSNYRTVIFHLNKLPQPYARESICNILQDNRVRLVENIHEALGMFSWSESTQGLEYWENVELFINWHITIDELNERNYVLKKQKT